MHRIRTVEHIGSSVFHDLTAPKACGTKFDLFGAVDVGYLDLQPGLVDTNPRTLVTSFLDSNHIGRG